MKTQCLQTNKVQHSFGKEKLELLDEKRKMLALIKGLIYARGKMRLGHNKKRSTKSLIQFVS